jgi:hypothetical protein
MKLDFQKWQNHDFLNFFIFGTFCILALFPFWHFSYIGISCGIFLKIGNPPSNTTHNIST